MPTKKRTNKALLKGLEHWEENARDFPYRQIILNKRRWFKINCLTSKCPLCKIFRFQDRCSGCPLNDKNVECCVEWEAAAIAINISKHHIKSVRDRIKRECEKRGLLTKRSK